MENTVNNGIRSTNLCYKSNSIVTKLSSFSIKMVFKEVGYKEVDGPCLRKGRMVGLCKGGIEPPSYLKVYLFVQLKQFFT